MSYPMPKFGHDMHSSSFCLCATLCNCPWRLLFSACELGMRGTSTTWQDVRLVIVRRLFEAGVLDSMGRRFRNITR